MDILFLYLSAVLVFCEMIRADKSVETFEKFYMADMNYVPKPGTPHQHGAMGISTVAKFSMLSNTPTLFKVKRPGLKNEPNTVSFESIQKPGYYLRYKNYKFHMEKEKETRLFAKDATFRERQGPRGRAYELLERDNWFMCHSDVNPFTLKAKVEQIGTNGFVTNCVFVPVRQKMVDKKNIVKTVPSGGAMVVNAVPATQNTDKCISLRFVNKLGGPVRVVSSMKPEGYLVTANAFKLKTIFKHANHKQRHVIFYAENVQDRDDDVLLNSKHVFTMKPSECADTFKDVVLSSQVDTQEATTSSQPKPPATQTNSAIHESSELKDKTGTPPGKETTQTPNIGINPPVMTEKTLKAMAQAPGVTKPPAMQVDVPQPPAMNVEVPKPPGTIPKLASDQAIISSNAPTEAHEIGIPSYPTASTAPTASNTPVKKLNNFSPMNILPGPVNPTGPLKQEIKSLDNVLQKRVKGIPTSSVVGGNNPSLGIDASSLYEPWSSFGPCSVTCGVGYRRRTRVCKPGMFCGGPAAESRACIKEQCATNCIHTRDGNVRPGSCCSFPFNFNGAQYNHCILSQRNNDRLWCSTTPYFDQDKQWGFCPHYVKAPARSLPQPARPLSLLQQQQQQPYMAPNFMATGYPSYYNSGAYKSPYRAYKDNSIPCNPACYRVCDPSCPRYCCSSARTDVPISAYLGGSYGPTDRRSTITSNQPRYRRSLLTK